MFQERVVFCFLLLFHAVVANTSLWDHVVKMEQVILSVEYNQRHLNVWKEDSRGYNRFYVTPLCTLETSSINCTRDEYSNDHRHVLTFHVKLWDSLAAETVKLALAQKNIVANVSDILPLPMLLVRLGLNQDVTNKINVNKEWRSNQDQPNIIIFELYTKHKHFCDKMVEDVKSDPENFLARTKLFLEFTMVVGQQASRTLNVTGQTFVKSDFFSNLDNHHTNDDARDVYRTATAQEEVTSTYVPSEQENLIISELLGVIKDQTVQSNDLTKDEWNSVFWNDIFSRPDVQTEYFNEALKYDKGESMFKYDEEKDKQFRENIQSKHRQEKEKNKSKSFGFSYAGFGKKNNTLEASVNGSGSKSGKKITDDENIQNTESIDKNSMSKEGLQKFLRKENVNVRWSGTKFTPKNLLLYRLNTKSLKASGEVFYKRIVTTKFESVQKIEIRPEPLRQTSFEKPISPVYYEEVKNQLHNLQQLLDNSTTIIKTQIAAANDRITATDNKHASDVANINQHITNVVNDVNGKRGDLQNQHNLLRNDHNGLRNEHNALRNDYNSLRNEYNTLWSWSHSDLWNHVQGIFRHVDNIWLRTFNHGTPDDVREAYKSRWGVDPGE